MCPEFDEFNSKLVFFRLRCPNKILPFAQFFRLPLHCLLQSLDLQVQSANLEEKSNFFLIIFSVGTCVGRGGGRCFFDPFVTLFLHIAQLHIHLHDKLADLRLMGSL